MREHEVPTHVQAEDRVLLWFTFPQIVAMTAVCALSYGAYRYAPVGPSEVRMALAVLMGLLGIAMVVGKIGGRRLPLVAADLLRYRLGTRRYAGPVSQLVRSESPTPVRPVRRGPGPLSLLARRLGKTLRRFRRRREGQRQNGRMPFRPHRWIGRRRQKRLNDKSTGGGPQGKKARRRRFPRMWAAVIVVALAVVTMTVPQGALAFGPEEEGALWSSPEIEFEVPEPVPGRRLFVEGLTVSGDTAVVTLRAAMDLDIGVRAYGARLGNWLRFWESGHLEQGESISYSLPLDGPVPSLTFSWEDTLGQAGAFTLKGKQLPYPLPMVEGEICNVRLASLGWTPGVVEGVVESECASRVKKAVVLQTVAGHAIVTETALMDAAVTGITGIVAAVSSGSRTAVPLVSHGETRFQLPVGSGKANFPVTMVVEMEAALSIPLPPLTRLTHHPEKTEHQTRTVSLTRPGTTRTVSETVTIENSDGTTTEHTISATLSIPSRVVQRDVTLTILHPERVEAQVVEREPATRRRGETLLMASTVGSDDPYQTLVLPERKPETPPAEQRPADSGVISHWFDLLGWEWPW